MAAGSTGTTSFGSAVDMPVGSGGKSTEKPRTPIIPKSPGLTLAISSGSASFGKVGVPCHRKSGCRVPSCAVLCRLCAVSCAVAHQGRQSTGDGPKLGCEKARESGCPGLGCPELAAPRLAVPDLSRTRHPPWAELPGWTQRRHF